MNGQGPQYYYRDKRVVDFRMGDKASSGDVIYRLYQEYDTEESQQELMQHFFSQVDAASVQTLIVGLWQVSYEDSPQDIVQALIERKDDLVNLRALFVGEISSEENEISWIIQTDYGPLLKAFPLLESLQLRGGNMLGFPEVEHNHLKQLIIETGGLGSAVVEGIAKSRLPALRHLELWLGDDNYGFDGNLHTYAALLESVKPERLEYLGLRNAMISDELAEYVARQSWLAEIGELDFSMGTMGDRGAQALCESPYIAKLPRLNLMHNYISKPWQEKLAALGPKLLIDEAQASEEDDERYVEVGE